MTPDGFGCDHCYYRNSAPRHQRYLDRLRERQQKADELRALTEDERLRREIEEAFRETTTRTAPGGSDDGTATVGLEWLEQQQSREGPEVTGRELMLHRRFIQTVTSRHRYSPELVRRAIAAAIAKQTRKEQ